MGAQLDLARAARLYRFAAEQGLASAQYSLGRCYHEGTGIEAVRTHGTLLRPYQCLAAGPLASIELAQSTPLPHQVVAVHGAW
eukprot:COSAG01_NODE_4092_length_5356_cov_137.323378_3_plen_83_part_00